MCRNEARAGGKIYVSDIAEGKSNVQNTEEETVCYIGIIVERLPNGYSERVCQSTDTRQSRCALAETMRYRQSRASAPLQYLPGDRAALPGEPAACSAEAVEARI